MKVLNRNQVISVTRPNWASPVSVDYTFLTSVFTSRDGTEKREAMRQTARMTVQFVTALQTAGFQRHMADLASDPSRIFYLPARWRSTFLAVSAAAETVELVVQNPRPFWVVPGQSVVVTDEENEEAAVVLAVVGSVVTLASPLTVAFATGSRVMMAHKARAASQSQFQALTDSVWVGNVRYDVDPGSEPQAHPPSALPTFEGRELFLTKPNWRTAPENQFEAQFDAVDSGRGTIAVTTPQIDHTRLVKMGYIGRTAADTDQIVSFFLRHKGKRSGFFMPSWQNDITQIGTRPVGSSHLNVEGEDFRIAYEGSMVYNVVIVVYADGSYQVNRISNITTNAGGDSRVEMIDPWAKEVTPSEKVSFCHHWRFAADTLSVRWLSSEVSEIEIAVQTLQNAVGD